MTLPVAVYMISPTGRVHAEHWWSPFALETLALGVGSRLLFRGRPARVRRRTAWTRWVEYVEAE